MSTSLLPKKVRVSLVNHDGGGSYSEIMDEVAAYNHITALTHFKPLHCPRPTPDGHCGCHLHISILDA